MYLQAVGINVNPLYLMMPVTICCSYAFMLPVATPPNAIVYSASKMSSSQMVISYLWILLYFILIYINQNTKGRIWVMWWYCYEYSFFLITFNSSIHTYDSLWVWAMIVLKHILVLSYEYEGYAPPQESNFISNIAQCWRKFLE